MAKQTLWKLLDVYKRQDTIVDVELEGKVKHLKGNHGDYYAKAVVIATGASPRPIGCPGEKMCIRDSNRIGPYVLTLSSECATIFN